MLDATDGLLKGTMNLYSKILLPAVNATENWGALNQSKHGEKVKDNFKDTITRYVSFLDGKREVYTVIISLFTVLSLG